MAALAIGTRVNHIGQRDSVAKWNAKHPTCQMRAVVGTVTGHRDCYSPLGTGSIERSRWPARRNAMPDIITAGDLREAMTAAMLAAARQGADIHTVEGLEDDVISLMTGVVITTETGAEFEVTIRRRPSNDEPPDSVLDRKLTVEDVAAYPGYFIMGAGREAAEQANCDHGYRLTDSCPACP